MSIQSEIIEALKIVTRPGMDELMRFLSGSDYFQAPASTKYHGSYKGGLAVHSMDVARLFKQKNEQFKMGLSDESVLICSLLHDVCKVNYYVIGPRGYTVRDEFPIGHGEKSVIVIQRYIKLTDEEAAIIRWHMNAWDASLHSDYPNGFAFRAAVEKWPAIVALYTADYEATTFVKDQRRPVG